MPNPHHQRQVKPRSSSGSESFSLPRRNDEPFDPHCPTSYSAYLPPEQQRELVNVMQGSLRALEDALLGNIYIARFAASILAAIEAKQSAIERASQPKGRRKRGVAGAKSRGRANQVLAEVDPPSTSMLLSTIEEKTVEAVSQRSPRAFSRHNLRTFTPLIRERLSLIDEHIHQWASAHESLHDKRTPSALRSTARKSMQFHSHCATELIRSIGNLRFIRDSLLEQLRGVASSVAEGGATSNTQPLSQEVYAALQETPESFSKRLAEVNEAHERAYSARNTLMITNQAMVSSVAARVLRSFSKIRIHLRSSLKNGGI